MRLLQRLHKRLKFRGNRGGFTLVETMVGMMIFTVGFTAVLYMQIAGIRAHVRAREQVNEIHSTIGQLEALKMPFRWNSELLQGDSVGLYHSNLDLPLKDLQTMTYTVFNDTLVADTQIIVVTNLRNPNAQMYSVRGILPRIR
jgi:prepilin-type N-terminal cleavage/methylation domain-containing protein